MSTSRRLQSKAETRSALRRSTRAASEMLEARVLLSVAMVEDINTDTLNSSPGNWAAVNGKVVFTATAPATGTELYVHDPATAQTQLLADIRPGNSTTFPPREIVPSGDGSFALFYADDGVNGYELWRTDGTAAGTQMVKDIRPGSAGSARPLLSAAGVQPVYLTRVGQTFFFAAENGATGLELFKSDGTEAGTVLVADKVAGTGDFSPIGLKNVAGTLMFAATDSSGRELWKSDGNTITQVRDIFVGTTGSITTYAPAVLGSEIFFVANNGSTGSELWKSDGTFNGTVVVKDIRAGTSTTQPPESVTAVGNRIYFGAYDATNGYALYVTDGTPQGTTFVRDFHPSGETSLFSNLKDFNGTLMLRAYDGASGYELWRSDGTSGGTVLVKDVESGGTSSSPQDLTVMNGVLYFSVFKSIFPGSTNNGVDLWRSDGTTQGTSFVRAFRTNGSSSSLGPTLAVGSTLYFAPNAPGLGVEPWKTDGTAAGSELLLDINTSTANSITTAPVASGGKAYFAASTAEHGSELWVSDGTESGTHMVADLVPGPGSSSPQDLFDVGGTLYFAATTPELGRELYRIEGDTAVLVKDINPGTAGSNPRVMANLNGVAFLAANDGVHNEELWKSDGTAEGTVMVANMAPDPYSLALSRMVTIGNWLYFQTNVAQVPTLWRTDGTSPANAITNYSGTLTGFLNVGGTLFLTTNAGLYKTGGDNASTVQITGSFTIPFIWTAALGSTLIFTADNATTGYEIYRVAANQTVATLLSDINPTGSSSPSQFTVVGDKLYFLANDGANASNEEAVWVSGGTTGTTMLVKRISGGTTKVAIQLLKGVGDKLYFRATHNTTGSELWVSDGTPAGTNLVADINPGTGSSTPSNAAVIGETMLFTATTSATGTELFRVGPVAELLDDGTILVRGTLGDDDIDIVGSGYGGYDVRVNGEQVHFDQLGHLRIAGGGGDDEIFVSEAAFTLDSDLGEDTFNAQLRVAGNSSVTFDASQHLASLKLIGGHAIMDDDAPHVLVTRELLMAGGTLDLGRSTALVDYAGTSPIGGWNAGGQWYDGLLGDVGMGRGAAQGIFSATALASTGLHYLGIAEASDVLSLSPGQTEIFAGETVDATTVIIKYTYAGDIDLNGAIDGDDYFRLDSNILQSGSIFGPWAGDVNLDGVIDGDDYFVLDSNIAAQGAPL